MFDLPIPRTTEQLKSWKIIITFTWHFLIRFTSCSQTLWQRNPTEDYTYMYIVFTGYHTKLYCIVLYCIIFSGGRQSRKKRNYRKLILIGSSFESLPDSISKISYFASAWKWNPHNALATYMYTHNIASVHVFQQQKAHSGRFFVFSI